MTAADQDTGSKSLNDPTCLTMMRMFVFVVSQHVLVPRILLSDPHSCCVF